MKRPRGFFRSIFRKSGEDKKSNLKPEPDLKPKPKGPSSNVTILEDRVSPEFQLPSEKVEKEKILKGYSKKDTSAQKLPWKDEASEKAEYWLKNKREIQIPWHYNDAFGDNFKVLAVRAGGLGVVFFVKSTLFGERIYAAKTLQKFLKSDYFELLPYAQEKIANDFLEEALPWLEMGQHSNIVPVLLLQNIIHPKTKRNVPFVFSEFMEKGDLENLLFKKVRFDLEEAISAGLQVCEGLLHAYEHGLDAHKDLKPANIMVYREGVYKVTDFSAGVLGTPGYMAPEQVASRLNPGHDITVDRRADQFAIGIIILKLILGDHPFPWIKEVLDSKDKAKKFLQEGVGAISDDPHLPNSLKKVIERCLSKDQNNRFSDISALKDALNKVYRSEFGGDFVIPEVDVDDSAEWWFDRGYAFYNIGRYASAEIPFKEALKRLKRIPGTEIDQAGCLTNLGSVYGSTGRFSEAEAKYKKARGMYKAIPGTEINQARCLTNLGNVYQITGRFSEAEAKYKKALGMYKAIPGTDIDQARCLTNLGNVYQITGKFNEAEAKYKKALKMFKAIHGTEIEQAGCLMNLGSVYQSTGKFNEAEAKYKKALKMFKAIHGTEIEQAGCLMNLGNVYQSTGKFNEAEAKYKKALKMFKAIPGTEIDQARCLMNLGNVYLSTGRFSEAEVNYKKALGMYKAIHGTEIDQAGCLMNLGSVYLSTGRFSEAEVNYKKALGMYKAIPGTDIEQARCLMNLGSVYGSTGRFSEAEANLKEALKICNLYPRGTEQIKNACLELLSKIP